MQLSSFARYPFYKESDSPFGTSTNQLSHSFNATSKTDIMPVADAGPVSSYAETVAILAMLIEAGGSLKYATVADITGERAASSYSLRMKTLQRHAKLVVDDRKNGGKGSLPDLVGDELNGELPDLPPTPFVAS